jgi:hypothetical protein
MVRIVIRCSATGCEVFSRESTSKTHSGIALPNSTLTHIALGVGPIMNGLPRT